MFLERCFSGYLLTEGRVLQRGKQLVCDAVNAVAQALGESNP